MANTAVHVLTGPLCKLWEHRFSVPGLASIPPPCDSDLLTWCDVTEKHLWKPDELNLSTSTYLIPFQDEPKSAEQSRRIIKSAKDSLSKTKSCFPGRLSGFWGADYLANFSLVSRAEISDRLPEKIFLRRSLRLHALAEFQPGLKFPARFHKPGWKFQPGQTGWKTS